ncbi:hypothetical protein ABZ570_01385 [Micromonospora sp. NPDC007271]|uniref:hypothetical protein n=1 Tax=Micromonospora sp. NPDC007271 TaxID=3154587 RepID=UPI0033EE86AE
MSNPRKHPVEQPVFRSLMLTSLFLGVVLLALNESPSSGFVSVAALVLLAVFVVSFGLYWLAWVLREHELWREGRQGEGA